MRNLLADLESDSNSVAVADSPEVDNNRNILADLDTSNSQQKTFDPESDGYDYDTAIASGDKPDDTGHWSSIDPRTGMILKGRSHKTFNKTIEAEKALGNVIVKGDDGRYYSKQQQPSILETGTPEKPEDIVAQFSDMQDPNTGRDTVFVGRYTQNPIEKLPLGSNIRRVDSPAGVLYTTNKAKAARYEQNPTDDVRAEVLGYNEPKSKILSSGKPAQVVVVTDSNGHNLFEEATTDPNSVVTKYQKQGYKNIAIKTPAQVQANRALPADPQGLPAGWEKLGKSNAEIAAQQATRESAINLQRQRNADAKIPFVSDLPSLKDFKAVWDTYKSKSLYTTPDGRTDKVSDLTARGFVSDKYVDKEWQEVKDRAVYAASKFKPLVKAVFLPVYVNVKALELATGRGDTQAEKQAKANLVANMPKEFSGLGSISVPLTADLAKMAIDWNVLYPAYFKAAGVANKAIAQIPAVQKAGQLIPVP